MSKCVSSAGEYDDHETEPGNYICDLCGALDEDGALAELERLRKCWAAAWLAVCHGEESFGIDGTKWVRADTIREALAHKETQP